MNVQLIAYTQLSDSFRKQLESDIQFEFNERAAIALTCIRTCYSHNKPSRIVKLEGGKYFVNKATDGRGGTEADRLFRHITGSGHTSTLESINYSFAVEDVSRVLLAQLTRHRHLSFSVQSQRYNRLGSDDKSGGFDFMIPPSIDKNPEARLLYEAMMINAQENYDLLRELGATPEDARMVLPGSATTNIVLTGNLRTLLEFYNKRKPGKGAQYEITQLAEGIKTEILKVDDWLTPYFEEK